MGVDVALDRTRRNGAPRMPSRALVLASDEYLVALVRSGSDAAFETIYQRHHRALLALCRQLLGSNEDAQDALQQTLAAAYRDLIQSDKPIDLRPWLHTIARNWCLGVLRARRERPTDSLPESSTDHLSLQVLQREELRELLGDVAALPDDQREAIVLAAMGAWSYEEIAAIIGCPPARVNALVFQARRSLSATRTARETPCGEIREQLVTLSGAALRRPTLYRHLRMCESCRKFRSLVRKHRKTLGEVLVDEPVNRQPA